MCVCVCVRERECEIKSVCGSARETKKGGREFFKKIGEVRESEAIRRLKERLRI